MDDPTKAINYFAEGRYDLLNKLLRTLKPSAQKAIKEDIKYFEDRYRIDEIMLKYEPYMLEELHQLITTRKDDVPRETLLFLIDKLQKPKLKSNQLFVLEMISELTQLVTYDKTITEIAEQWLRETKLDNPMVAKLKNPPLNAEPYYAYKKLHGYIKPILAKKISLNNLGKILSK